MRPSILIVRIVASSGAEDRLKPELQTPESYGLWSPVKGSYSELLPVCQVVAGSASSVDLLFFVDGHCLEGHDSVIRRMEEYRA